MSPGCVIGVDSGRPTMTKSPERRRRRRRGRRRRRRRIGCTYRRLCVSTVNAAARCPRRVRGKVLCVIRRRGSFRRERDCPLTGTPGDRWSRSFNSILVEEAFRLENSFGNRSCLESDGCSRKPRLETFYRLIFLDNGPLCTRDSRRCWGPFAALFNDYFKLGLL